MNDMKRNVLIALCAPILLITLWACPAQENDPTNVQGAEEGEWVAEIEYNDTTITIYESEFNQAIDLALESVPPEQVALIKGSMQAKQQVLDTLISQHLVLEKADEEEFFDSPEAREYLATAVRQLKMNYYLMERYANEDQLASIPEPTEAEIQQAYAQTREILAQRGITSLNAQARALLRNEIRQQKLQQQALLMVQDLRDAAAIRRNREIVGESFGTPTTPATPGTPGLGGGGLLPDSGAGLDFTPGN